MEIRLAHSDDRIHVVPMVNEVYSTSEKEFWGEGYYRIDDQEFDNYINGRWLYVGVENGEVVGCILLKKSTPNISCFSMLVCHPDHRKKGVGGKLVDHVFKVARDRGDVAMRLEILAPKDWVHEEKAFLKSWYESMGFELVSETDFAKLYPTHAQFMQCELVFGLYQMNLD